MTLVDTKRGTFNMRRARLGLLLIIFDVLVFSSSLLIKNEVSALSGTGVGIRKDGPTLAHLNDTIEYVITVYNLGDYWIRNATITDLFPNGTSKSWNVPDLAPLGQLGDSFNISNILYTIQGNVFPGNPAYIINHAEVTGYSDIQGFGLPASALTNFITFLRFPVGGYTVSIKTTSASTPITIYTVSPFVVIAALSLSCAFRRKAYPSRKTTPEGNSTS